MVNNRSFLTTTQLPQMHSHCKLCECRLLVNEEWHTGYCLDCADRRQLYWESVLDELADTADEQTVPTRVMHR